MSHTKGALHSTGTRLTLEATQLSHTEPQYSVIRVGRMKVAVSVSGHFSPTSMAEICLTFAFE